MVQSRSLAAVALAVALAACSENGVVDSAAPADAELAALLASESAGPREPGARGGGSALFDRLAAEIPGFGGLYRTQPCAVSVVLTDMSQAGHALQVVKAALERLVARSCPHGVHVHPVQGQFTYIELQRYLAAAQPLLEIRGVNGIRVSYPLNRLVITVAARAVVPVVLEALPRLGVPQDAVVFQGAAPGGRG